MQQHATQLENHLDDRRPQDRNNKILEIEGKAY